MEWSIEFLCLFCVGLFCGKSSAAQFNLYHGSYATFEDAKDYCAMNNRFLAKIDSTYKHKRVKTLKPYMEGHFWIGLKGNGIGAQSFSWLDSSDLDYSNWASGFPGYHDGLDCVRMRSDDFKWETFNCSQQLNFLCEDRYFKKSSTVTTVTKVKGIFFGLGVIGGLLTLICLLLQLPCCRTNVTDKIAHIGFGTSDFDHKRIKT